MQQHRWSASLVVLVVAIAGSLANAAEKPSVVGVVTFNGKAPQPQRLRLVEKGGKLSDCHKLHKEGRLLDENYIISNEGEIKNVFVYVKKGLPRGKKYPLPKKSALLNQVGCMFQPRVQGVRVGQEFVMRNGDPLIHNIRSFSFRNRPFNIAQPAKSEDRKKVFRTKEKAILIQCDIHPWMKAYYFVMDHPYFFVTDSKGRFYIAGLPPGKYTISAWHEELGELSKEVTVKPEATAEANFTFEPKKKDPDGS